MNYCPNCGRKLEETDDYCPSCGARISAQSGSQPAVSLKKNENGQEYSEAGESQAQFAAHKEPAAGVPQGGGFSQQGGFNEPSGFQRESQEPFSNGLKVLFVAINLLVPIIGFVFGVISAIVFMRKKNPDYKSFGKSLLVLNIIVLVFFLLSCYFFTRGYEGFIRSFENELRERGYNIEEYDEFYHDFDDSTGQIF